MSKISPGIEPLVDEFMVFNSKTPFLTSSTVTSVNSKLFELICGKKLTHLRHVLKK